jgi:pyruvate,water dikinase
MAGVITARGSALSHVSILAREYGIPAVVGHALARELQPGQEVSLDGSTGEVTVIGD